MRLNGIHYDIGTQTIEASSSRPTLSIELIEQEMGDIAHGLHANAVRITGGDIQRMASAAEIAAHYGLEVWLSPMLPNADQPTTLTAITEVARIAERLRQDGTPTVLVIGCESSVFMSGILPGVTHADRFALLLDPNRLMAEVQARGKDPQALFAAFLQTGVENARSNYLGPVTYASGVWEEVDWSLFDFVSVDAYRDASNRDQYEDILRRLSRYKRPVVITEFGCATYRGAAGEGGMAWTAVDRQGRHRKLREGIERDEEEQARELSELLSAAESCNVDGAFIYTYVAPTYPASLEASQDLDAASYALVRSWPDGRTEEKAAYRVVANAFAASQLH